MTDVDWKSIRSRFSAAFRDEEIGTNQTNKGGGPYVDARSVAERLDDVVGPDNWSTRFRLIDATSGAVECTLTVHGIERADIGYPNSPMGTVTGQGKTLENEPLKAAYSDAFKRASVQWGIGRYLYPYANKRKREAGEIGSAPTEEGPVNVDRDGLLERVGQALTVLSERRKTTGKKLMTEWMNETSVKVKGWDAMNNKQLSDVLIWINKQLQPAAPQSPQYTDEQLHAMSEQSKALAARTQGPAGQRYTPEQLENMPDAAKQEAARAQAVVDEAKTSMQAVLDEGVSF